MGGWRRRGRTHVVVEGNGLLLVKDPEGDGGEDVLALALDEGHLEGVGGWVGGWVG